MQCPKLPSIPTGIVSKIDPSWFRSLAECLQFAMTHPQGDGHTILNEAGGSLRAKIPNVSGGAAAASASGGGTILVQIISGDALHGYSAATMNDYGFFDINHPVTVFIPYIWGGYIIPAGTVLIAHKVPVPEFDGDEVGEIS